MSTFRPSIVEPLNKRTHLRRHAIRGRRLKVKLALTDGPDVLTRIVGGHPNRQLGGLLPWAYRHGYNPVRAKKIDEPTFVRRASDRPKHLMATGRGRSRLVYSRTHWIDKEQQELPPGRLVVLACVATRQSRT